MTDLQQNDQIKDTTAEFIIDKTKDTEPGAYTEQPKTHKFDKETQNISEGFPARGIISCRNTPTESLQDFIDFQLSQGMKVLPSYLKDTKHVLQKLHLRNEKGEVSDHCNLVTGKY